MSKSENSREQGKALTRKNSSQAIVFYIAFVIIAFLLVIVFAGRDQYFRGKIVSNVSDVTISTTQKSNARKYYFINSLKSSEIHKYYKTLKISKEKAREKLGATNQITIKNQSDLNDALVIFGSHIVDAPIYWASATNLKFPQGTLLTMRKNAEVRWKFPGDQKGNINFNDALLAIPSSSSMIWEFVGSHGTACKHMTIKNLEVYGSSSYEGQKNNGFFRASSEHSSHVTFTDMDFYAAQAINRHIFDNMGVDDYTFDGICVFGYGAENYTRQEVQWLYNASAHNVLSEAIQIDNVSNGASGGEMTNPNSLFFFEKSDRQASSNIEISHSAFMPYKGISGDSIINKNEKKVTRNLSTGIGAHAVGKKNYSGIWIHDCLFSGTTVATGSSAEKIKTVMYPIHIRLKSYTYNVGKYILIHDNMYYGPQKYSTKGSSKSGSISVDSKGNPYVGWTSNTKDIKKVAKKFHSTQYDDKDCSTDSSNSSK